MLYRSIAQTTISVAARAAGLVSLVSRDTGRNLGSQPDLATKSECFLNEVSVLSLLI